MFQAAIAHLLPFYASAETKWTSLFCLLSVVWDILGLDTVPRQRALSARGQFEGAEKSAGT